MLTKKENDPMHINVAELEAILKGVYIALQWGFKSVVLCRDSESVFGCLKSPIEKDKPIRVSGRAGHSALLRQFPIASASTPMPPERRASAPRIC